MFFRYPFKRVLEKTITDKTSLWWTNLYFNGLYSCSLVGTFDAVARETRCGRGFQDMMPAARNGFRDGFLNGVIWPCIPLVFIVHFGIRAIEDVPTPEAEEAPSDTDYSLTI